MIRRKLPLVLIIIGLLFGLIAMQDSAALSSFTMNRQTKAQVSSDNAALLKLEGFNSSQYMKLSSYYSKVGSITNNSSQPLNLNISVAPTQVFSIIRAYQLGIKIGTSSCILRSNTSSQQLTVSLMPGQSVDIQMNLTNSLLDFISTSFIIQASDNTRSLNLTLSDSDSTPRRILTY